MKNFTGALETAAGVTLENGWKHTSLSIGADFQIWFWGGDLHSPPKHAQMDHHPPAQAARQREEQWLG